MYTTGRKAAGEERVQYGSKELLSSDKNPLGPEAGRPILPSRPYSPVGYLAPGPALVRPRREPIQPQEPTTGLTRPE